MKDKGNRHGAVSKLSLEQQFCKSNVITFAMHMACSLLTGALHLDSNVQLVKGLLLQN